MSFSETKGPGADGFEPQASSFQVPAIAGSRAEDLPGNPAVAHRDVNPQKLVAAVAEPGSVVKHDHDAEFFDDCRCSQWTPEEEAYADEGSS